MIVHTSATHEFPVHGSYHDPFLFSDPYIAILSNHMYNKLQIKIKSKGKLAVVNDFLQKIRYLSS